MADPIGDIWTWATSIKAGPTINLLTSLATFAAAFAAWASAQATSRSVMEMRAARLQYSRPHLAVAVSKMVLSEPELTRESEFSGAANLIVSNIGAGAAVDVELTLILDMAALPLRHHDETLARFRNIGAAGTDLRAGLSGSLHSRHDQRHFSVVEIPCGTIPAGASKPVELEPGVSDALLAAALDMSRVRATVTLAVLSTANERTKHEYALRVADIEVEAGKRCFDFETAVYRPSPGRRMDRRVRRLISLAPALEEIVYSTQRSSKGAWSSTRPAAVDGTAAGATIVDPTRLNPES